MPISAFYSQDNHQLAKPLIYTSVGPVTFSYAAAQIWNAWSSDKEALFTKLGCSDL